MERDELRQVLQFWRDTEFFVPFDLDAALEFHELAIPLTLDKGGPLPWEQLSLFPLDPERDYFYDLFFAPFPKREVLRALERVLPKIGEEVFSEPRDYSGLSCFARISITGEGELNREDLSLSTLPWALDRIVRSEALRICDFDTFAETYAAALETVGKSENSDTTTVSRKLCHADLVSAAQLLIGGSSLTFFPNGLLGYLVPYPVRKKKKTSVAQSTSDDTAIEHDADEVREAVSVEIMRKKRKVDILNSFYLRDLERVAASLRDGVAPLLTGYLNESNETERLDLLKSDARSFLRAICSSDRAPIGRWLDVPERFLALNQEVALRHYLSAREHLVAVNGPPGTGKTTLVRDLVAEIIVQRAHELSKLQKPGDALEQQQNELRLENRRQSYRYRRLVPNLRGYEIVVASSNNAAVENISRELPRMVAISAEHRTMRYLTPIAKLLYALSSAETDLAKALQAPDANELWGLPSIPLGNAKNRRRFRAAAFLRPKDEDPKLREARKQAGALSIFEWRASAPENALSFQAAKRAFLEAFEQVEKHRSVMAHEPSDHPLMGPDDVGVAGADVQSSAPWVDSHGNTLRSNLLRAALTLQEAWVREVPGFEQELYSISLLLGNPGSLVHEQAGDLWQLLFMVVPVVSTTLASVERMFATLGRGRLGNVVIDEAGQAIPPAAAGLLMRARRALIIGDQRQLEPISLLPRHLEHMLGQGLSDEVLRRVSPRSGSVQSLADGQNRLGTYLGSGQDRIWIGIPLCVHRRCSDPMFSLANLIAYDNIMIDATPKRDGALPLGPSCWFDLEGVAQGRQWVPAQGELCRILLLKLLAQADDFPDVFFITPFRQIKHELRTFLGQVISRGGHPRHFRSLLRRRIGTVHTFQGKEADTVCLVLGCDRSTGRAADWAGEKPNLLNVAITRARRALYVIGDANIWHNRGYFSDLQKALPRRVVNGRGEEVP